MKETTYDVRFSDVLPYTLLGVIFVVITILTVLNFSDNASIRKLHTFEVLNCIMTPNKTSSSEVDNFDSKLEAKAIVAKANQVKEVKAISKSSDSKKITKKNKEALKLKKSHPSYTDTEVTLLGKLIYREMHGYYEEPSWYRLTKVEGLRAAIITGVVVRNRRDINDGYKTITDVITAKYQYGKGGKDTLNEINSVPATSEFYEIARAILNYDEVNLAKKLVGNEADFKVSLFKIPRNVYYQSQYTTLGSGHYAQIGNQFYNYK